MMKSYYSPTARITSSTDDYWRGTPIYQGMSHNIAVACELGREILFFKNGALAGERHLPEAWPRAIDKLEDMVIYADRERLKIFNEQLECDVALNCDLQGIITSIKVTKDKDGTYVTVCFYGKGPGNVKVYKWENGKLSHKYTNPHCSAEPRGAYYFTERLFVSDTFSNRVYVVDAKTSALVTSTEVYFPNTIEPVSENQVRICAEHENRVFIWQYASGESRKMEMSAPVNPFNKIAHGRIEIEYLQRYTASDDGQYDPPKSICAVEYTGDYTLYSPNSATCTDDGLLIADTDNHRVILVRDGKIVTTISGFNNPVNAIIF